MRLSALLTLALVACGPKDDVGTDTNDTKPIDTDEPSVPGELLASDPVVTPVDALRNPLAFVLTVETVEPTTLELSWGERVLPWPADGAAATAHEVPLLGFYPDSTTEVSIRVIGAEAEETHPVDVVTPPLPALFPRFEIVTQDKSRMQPGYTVFTVKPGDLSGPTADFDYIVAVDDDAQVVWFLKPVEKMFDASILEDGTLLTLAQPSGNSLGGPVVDSTLIGEELARFKGEDSSGPGIPVFDLGFHHEALRLGDGSTLVLSKEPVSVDAYPTSYDDPSITVPATVSADVAVRFAADGSPLGEWHFDWLPSTRIGYSGLETTHFDGLLDWTHGNGADHNEVDDSVIVSLRNQNAVIKLDKDGEPVWILGTHEAWPVEYEPLLLQPDGPVEWFFSQHAPMFNEDHTRVLLFDNGETRGVPGDGVEIPPEEERWSRLVEYEIDEATWTAKQTWEYREAVDGVLYSGVIGDADYLPNGNVLGCFGHTTYVDGVPNSSLGIGIRTARIIEVARDAPEETVFDLKVYSDGTELTGGWMTYRADRISDLY